MKRMLALMGLLAVPALAENPAPESRAGVPQAAFDDVRYALGYDVYVAGGNLPAAWQVARKAVSQNPGDPVWLKRYAQVSEWIGQPAEALAAWLRLARATGDDNSWEAVGRLAPMLLDDSALLAYQQRQAAQRPGDLPTLMKLVEVYERLGRPDEGLRFLRELDGGNRPANLEAQAMLAERSGQDGAAIETLGRLLARSPAHEAWLLRRAALQYRRGQLKPARDGLAAAEKQMPPTATGYWQTYAELSRLLDDRETARRAYQRLIDQAAAGENDLWNYAALLQDSDPLAAAGLQELLFRRFGQESGAVNALSLWQGAQAWAAADAFLAGLTPEQIARLERSLPFLEQRARLAWVRGRLAVARRDYLLGLRRSPDSLRLTQGLAGVLLEQNDTVALRHLLESREALARRHEALWPAWAAGWQRLRQLSRALPYQLAWQRRHPDDALAALALADTLDAQQRHEEARRLRQQVQHRASAYIDAERPERRRQLEDALLALELQKQPPDPAARRLRARLLAGPGDAFGRDLALGWLISHDAADAARRVAAASDGLARPPGWAMLGFALGDEDRPAMQALLNERLEELPIYDRLEAAERSGRLSLATDVAFRTLEDEAGDDDEAHRRFARLAAARGDAIGLESGGGRQGALDVRSLGFSWRTAPDDNLKLRAGVREERFSRQDAAALGRIPDIRRLTGLELAHQGRRSLWQGELLRLSDLTDDLAWAMAQTYRVDSRLNLGWRLERQFPTADSVALRVAGRDDRAEATLQWMPDGRHGLRLQVDRHDYQLAGGGRPGSGNTLRLEGSHRLFADQPDHVLKAQFSLGRFRTGGAPLTAMDAALVPAGISADNRFFMPRDYRQFALGWAVGQLPEEAPARGWRGFGEAGLNTSDNGGAGYQLLLGAQGPLLGGDRLSLSLRAGRSGQSQGDDTRELNLNYLLSY
jgi:hypothetical protein